MEKKLFFYAYCLFTIGSAVISKTGAGQLDILILDTLSKVSR